MQEPAGSSWLLFRFSGFQSKCSEKLSVAIDENRERVDGGLGRECYKKHTISTVVDVGEQWRGGLAKWLLFKAHFRNGDRGEAVHRADSAERHDNCHRQSV